MAKDLEALIFDISYEEVFMGYWVYIATNRPKGVLYTGVTNDISRRMHEHRQHLVKGFTDKYRIHHLVYAKEFLIVNEAIGAEKMIKGWTRVKKLRLIEQENPGWLDLVSKA